MQASLTDGGWPSPGATVTVTVARPDGGVNSNTLFDDGAHEDQAPGDGIFGANYISTHPGGVYDFYFHSTGTTTRGENVTREALRTQFVGTPSSDPRSLPCIPCLLLRFLVLFILALIALLLVALDWKRVREILGLIWSRLSGH